MFVRKKKIAFFIWVGGGPMKVMHKKCIDSWAKYCPKEYEIVMVTEYFPKTRRLLRKIRENLRG